ncbi:protein NRT1/ PTR FAMILY 4.5-like [Prunus yedoensis var. nudiflora]|uniref:Protein NRT1/ PTR FAMILY 4.5-like n=1 Tax=Prunus yedoensis var. nudiflora TaxID=2094558 RepID=A0A314Z599_PRUYE|nr:protein NRT1/ PTR FAMILY 4.5-like [Prunus yedoensis var. nudiflora]
MGICGGGFEGQPKQAARLGGNRAALFVYATEGLENMSFVANAVSLVTYFYGYMNLSLTKSATTLTNFMGTAFILTLVGGFISDTYWSRFKTCVVFGFIELLGLGLLTVQAHFHQLRPFPCQNVTPGPGQTCEAADTNQLAILYTGLYLVALGTSGVKSALPALGADQFDEKDPNGGAQLSSFFNWFLFSLTIGAIFGVTFCCMDKLEPGLGLGLRFVHHGSLLCCFVCVHGKVSVQKQCSQGQPPPKYPTGSHKFCVNNWSPASLCSVLVAATKNRKLRIPENADELHEIHDKEAGEQNELLQRTDQFRFLDRAAIRGATTADGSSTSKAHGSWDLCTVTQVEETKHLIRMLPIIFSTVFMNTCMAQLQTFSIQQSNTMDTHILGFKIPGPSIPVIPLLFMFFLIPIYERVFVPIARKFTGIPTGIRHLQRIAVGLVLSVISMAVAALIETRRKSVAIEHNMVDSIEPLPMSVFWLGLQYAIFGAADMFTLVGLLEFFYAESAAGMKSLSTAISWCSIAFGYFLSSMVVEVVNKVSGGWLASNNLNRDKLNYFYWLLAGLSVLNFVAYLLCASWYKYKKVEVFKQCDLNGKVELVKA